MRHVLLCFALACITTRGVTTVGAAEPLPPFRHAFLETHCFDCHSHDAAEGEIVLDQPAVDWQSKDALLLWERVLNALKSGEMPPPDAGDLTDKDRTGMVRWVDRQLTANTEIGGTRARRLNQTEYRATVESLFGVSPFPLPAGFPADREFHGYDNVGEGLVLSPPLLEAYADTARLIADTVFPPPRPAPKPMKAHADAKGLVISYSSGMVFDGAMRLGMKCDPITRSCTWPSRIETEASGIYRLRLSLGMYKPRNGQTMTVRVFARDVASQDGVSHRSLRLLKELTVTSESPETFEFEAELFAGQTPVIHWADASLDSDRGDKEQLQQFFLAQKSKNPKYLDAWHAMVQGGGQGFRGGIGWARVKDLLADPTLPSITEEQEAEFLKLVAKNPVLYAETVVYDIFENGPALEIHGLDVEGPSRLTEGPREREVERLQHKFLSDSKDIAGSIEDFLTRAFRRPVDASTRDLFVGLYNDHLAAGHTRDESLHLVIRTALVSPRFLYRSLSDGPLDDYDLAVRLSYFLTGRPADTKLLARAAAGKLASAKGLLSEAKRLMPKKADAPFVVNFTGQWLDTRKLPDIMPDPVFKFTQKDQLIATKEVEAFFFEMLNENRPMTDFIDPDFTWTSARIAKNIYGLKDGYDKKKPTTLHRVSMPRGGRHGGVLGQAAVMMATANGVDTQPVLRGVWVLENILGTPPPPPPKSVPALTPDTNGATTPRELLAAHTKEDSCAGCHRKIDPVGLALENFDPVGRWRERWPGSGVEVDSASTLPDGTSISGIVDLKAWLVDNVDQFSECLAEQLMTYATGRVPNYSERKQIARIVQRNHENGNGFRDLVLALIDSDVFRTK